MEVLPSPNRVAARVAYLSRVLSRVWPCMTLGWVPSVVDAMDWVFVQDAAALNGITRDALRRRFQAWAEGEAPGNAAVDWARGARYECFLQADEHVLTSMLQPPEDLSTPHVNLVRSWPGPPPTDEAFDEDGETFDLEDRMKMALGAVYPSNYVEMDNPESWYVYYRDWEQGVWVC